MTTPVTLQLVSNNDGSTVAEFVVSTTADVLAAHGRLLQLAQSVYADASQPREALPVQEQVNDVVLGNADYVTALGYTLTVKPEPVAEPEPEAQETEQEDSDTAARLSRVESMLQRFAQHFGVQL